MAGGGAGRGAPAQPGFQRRDAGRRRPLPVRHQGRRAFRHRKGLFALRTNARQSHAEDRRARHPHHHRALPRDRRRISRERAAEERLRHQRGGACLRRHRFGAATPAVRRGPRRRIEGGRRGRRARSAGRGQGSPGSHQHSHHLLYEGEDRRWRLDGGESGREPCRVGNQPQRSAQLTLGRRRRACAEPRRRRA